MPACTYARRDTIGTDETLNGATAEGLSAFYRRWYRPERTTIVMVGDADPEMMEALIRARFGGWRARGRRRPSPITAPSPRSTRRSPTSPIPARRPPPTWSGCGPIEALPHTMARERLFLEEMLAAQIINRRLEAHARGNRPSSAPRSARSRSRNIANSTQLSLVARGGDWRAALTEAYAIVGDALRAPPSRAEIERELENLRTAATAAVQSEPTDLVAGVRRAAGRRDRRRSGGGERAAPCSPISRRTRRR